MIIKVFQSLDFQKNKPVNYIKESKELILSIFYEVMFVQYFSHLYLIAMLVSCLLGPYTFASDIELIYPTSMEGKKSYHYTLRSGSLECQPLQAILTSST